MSGIFNFLKHYGAAKGESMEQEAVNLAAMLDKDGVAQAAIRQKMEEHEQHVRYVAEAKAERDKEKREFDAEQARHNQMMAAAERAQAALEANPEDADARTALTELLEALEAHLPKLEKEKREYEDAEAHFSNLEEAMQEIATELRELNDTVEQAKRELKEAEVEADRTRKQRERAEVAARLKKSGNKFDTAINALKSAAEQKKLEAEQNRMVADNLTPAKKPDLSSAASRFMQDAPSTTTESLQERLARLKK